MKADMYTLFTRKIPNKYVRKKNLSIKKSCLKHFFLPFT